jgi:hypothetical protein
MSDWTRYAASRRTVLLGGLAAGLAVVGRAATAAASEVEFRCCARCGGAWWGGGTGGCPAGRPAELGRHLDATADRIAARPARTSPGTWSCCATCGLLYHPGAGAGACANGLARRHSAAHAYALAAAPGWRCCVGCTGLFRSVDGPQWRQCGAGGEHRAGSSWPG